MSTAAAALDITEWIVRNWTFIADIGRITRSI